MKNPIQISPTQVVELMIESIKDNPQREGLKDTPNRVAKMWNEMFRGYDINQKPKITVFPNNGDGINYDQMIMDTGYFYSQCEHHMVPFFGTYYFAYIPNKKVLGLSKVARIVDYYAAKLQVQERLGKEIVDELEKELKPKGIALVLKARHLCKEMRGVKKINGEMTTSDLRGAFRKEPETRAEFISFITK
jgi:GTP cyclohydrolase I